MFLVFVVCLCVYSYCYAADKFWASTDYVKLSSQTADVSVDSMTISINGVTKTVSNIYNAAKKKANPTGYNSSSYSCAAYVHKFYSQVYGVEIYNLLGPSCIPQISSGGGYFTKVPSPQIGDIIRVDTSTHWAVVKSVDKNGTVTVMQQNAGYFDDAGIYRAMINMKVNSPYRSISFFRWSGAPNGQIPVNPSGDSSSWTDLHTEDSKYGLFNAQVNWKKSLKLKEVGCFVGTSKSQVEGAKMNVPNGTAVRKDVINSNIESMASYLATDTTYGLIVFYKGPGFDTISRFIGGATYYYKFYSYTSDEQVVYSSVEEYTPALTGSEKLTNVWMEPSTDIKLTVGDSINLTFGSDEAVTFYFHIYDLDTGSDTSTEIGKNMISGSYTYTFNKAGSYNIWMGAAHKSGDKASNGIIVTVNPPIISVSSIVLDQNNVKLETGNTTTLKALISPDNATNKSVTWSSSDNSVAKVDANGKITAVKSGKATITVTTEDGKKTATCTVTVSTPPAKPVSVTGVKLNKTSLTLTEKNTATLTATVVPADANNKKVTWSSSDSSVAKVDANGKVTAVKSGKAIITVTTEDGKKTATCTVTVSALPEKTVSVTGVKLNKTSLTLTEKDTATLTATVAPANASNKKVTWSSSNSSVAKVDANGKITAVKSGKATITVTTEDGKKTTTCTVTVNPKDKVTAFVTRCYNIILGREPDAGGLKTWYNELTSGRKSASEIIDRFVNSPEFQDKDYSKGDSVEILYKAMLGRGSDPNGKKNWVDKLINGQPFAVVINGFCVSKEFNDICASYGIKPGSVTIPEDEPKTPDEKTKAFVRRCYQIILNREPDEGGMNTWFNELKSRRKAASEIIDRFVNSPEFQGKDYTRNESVEILYKAMLGRGSDPAGKKNWVDKLKAGEPFAVIINGFCVSKEFRGICDSYGITPGSVKVQYLSRQSEEELSMLALNAKAPITRRSETRPNRVEIINPSDTIDMNIGTAVQAVYINEEKAKEFIGRCYQVILGREASAAELENWIGQMVNGTKTPDQIARGFLFSNEFKAKNVDNENLVKILYRVYMNRDADPEGLKTWTEKLDNGTALKDLLDTFSKTNEFKKVVSEMGR